MNKQEIERYEQLLEENKDQMGSRIFGSYLSYIDRYLHDKENRVDGMTWEERMKKRPMPQNIYLYG